MPIKRNIIMLALTALVLAAGCETTPATNADRDALHAQVQAAIATVKATDPGIATFFNTSAGYAVFPSVGKGGAIVGGAYGKGELFEKGVVTGYCSLTQGTIGLQLGGQSYIEIIFFENAQTLADFKAQKTEFAAQVSAVALKAGASANAKYVNGVLVFTHAQGGLMAEAALGGQKFGFEPK